MTRKLLACKDVVFRYDGQTVLNGATLTVEEGEFVGVIGPNGAGKSTLLKILSGVLHPETGWVTLGGIPIKDIPRREVARQVAVVAQEETPEFGFSVRDQVLLGRAPHHGGLYFETPLDGQIVEDAMEKTGIAHLENRSIEALSAGERQRVRIARGVSQQPRVLLLDEPTNHLDLYSQLSLMSLLRNVNQEGIAILLVSHDINFVAQCCEEVNILHLGQFRFSGAPGDVITPDNVAATFGIRSLVEPTPFTGVPRLTPIDIL